MKITFITFYLFIIAFIAKSQSPFLFSVEHVDSDKILDAIQIGDKFYLIRFRVENVTPQDFDGYSDLFITTEDGHILEEISLGGFGTVFERFLKIEENDIYMVGYVKTDTCQSKLIVSKFNLENHALTNLSTLDFCDHLITRIRTYKDLRGNTFIDEVHTYSTGYAHQIFKLESDYHLKLMIDSVSVTNAFSEDFSRKGFLFSFSSFYYFYDQNFNFIKQVYSPQVILCIDETTIPFGQNLILQQSVQDKLSNPEDGIHVRLIDSNINVIKKVIFFPPDTRKTLLLPYFNGMDVKNNNEIWSAGYYEPLHNEIAGFYYVAKLDSNLNIICQHFLGYDSDYWLFGIRALNSGGAIVFGSRVRDGHQTNEGEDSYAIRVGENCELPAIVATDDPHSILQSISAFPNPGLDDITFNIHGFDPSTLRVEMIDLSGKVIFKINDLSNSIRIPQLPAGQYFYRILQDARLLGIGSWVKE